MFQLIRSLSGVSGSVLKVAGRLRCGYAPAVMAAGDVRQRRESDGGGNDDQSKHGGQLGCPSHLLGKGRRRCAQSGISRLASLTTRWTLYGAGMGWDC